MKPGDIVVTRLQILPYIFDHKKGGIVNLRSFTTGSGATMANPRNSFSIHESVVKKIADKDLRKW